jgi:hypothetical protein
MSNIPRPQPSSPSPPLRHGLAPTSADDLPSCGVTEPPLQGNHPSRPQSPSEDPAEVSESLTGLQAPESASPAARGGSAHRRTPRPARLPPNNACCFWTPGSGAARRPPILRPWSACPSILRTPGSANSNPKAPPDSWTTRAAARPPAACPTHF